jgi:hypothetical protein
LGLAILTKATAYLFAAPFVAWFGLWLLKTKRWQAWGPILVISGIVLLVNVGHFYRNFQLFNSPLGPGRAGPIPGFEFANQTIGTRAFISNLVRNAALHVNTPIPMLNAGVEYSVQALHRWLNINPDDPRITWGGTHFEVNLFIISEDVSGNFVHLLLILLSLTVIIIWKVQRKVDSLFTYSMLVTTAFLLFAFYLKWQPWHSRLHLPLFILWSPVIGLLLAQIPYRHALNVTAILLVTQAAPFLLFNPTHPLVGQRNIFNLSRAEQYFLTRPILQEPYLLAAQLIEQRKCRQVGLSLPPGTAEYLFWVVIQQQQQDWVHIEHLDVKNESAIFQSDWFEPCAVICLACPELQQKLYAEKVGPPALSYDSNILFIK